MGKMSRRFIEQGYLERDELKQLLHAGLQTESFHFVRRLCLSWLDKYRGDLEIQIFLAKSLAATGKNTDAAKLLERISKLDPEYMEVHNLLASYSVNAETSQNYDSMACVYAMGKSIYSDFKIPEWSFLFRASWQAYLANQFDNAEQLIKQVIVQKPHLDLAAILHQRIVASQGDAISRIQLAKIYNSRFPLCLNFKLIIADALMDEGEELEAVNLLRDCAANDSFGVVPKRLWGEDQPYAGLWPDDYRIRFDISLPAEVGSYLGWNNLPEGEISSTTGKTIPPEMLDSSKDGSETQTLIEQAHWSDNSTQFVRKQQDVPYNSVDEIFEKLSKKLKDPDLVRTEGKFPVYLILSVKSRLIKHFGKQTFLILDTEMRRLSTEISRKKTWRSMVYYPDDATSAIAFGISAIDSVDPWKIKNALADLDRILAKKGEMIGALLIVGGPEIVPYHLLPNPTDDNDIEVASDNPYATLDRNYFVPEWPVGRIPGSSGTDAGLLLSQLRVAISKQVEVQAPASWLSRIMALINLFSQVSKLRKKKKGIGGSSFGFSAAAWLKSSISTFRPISNGNKMLSSPPEFSGSFNPNKASSSRLGYFNLHGLEDSSDWYGQREIGDESSQADYPVALTPKDIVKNENVPDAVLSEACYGGYIESKNEDQSLALKFLSIGTSVFIGSTCISYGSIGTPLIGADLLANYFWKYIKNGSTAGEAFIKAKFEFVKEMNNRQGFLDGEDQKTLLSFILFGDPLSQIGEVKKSKKSIVRRSVMPRIKIMADQEDQSADMPHLPQDTLLEVKKIAEEYLPGLEDVEITVTQQYLVCDPITGKCQPKKLLSKKEIDDVQQRGQTVVTVRKVVPVQKRVHRHYLRAKVDRDGKLIKLAISR